MTEAPTRTSRILRRIRPVPDWPQAGVLFRDLVPLLADAPAFAEAVEAMASSLTGTEIDAVAAIESRGFWFGAPIAARLGTGLLPLRKPGKLPPPLRSESYTLEYGMAALEVPVGAVRAGSRVAIVDDVLATGGTAVAAFRLLEKLRVEVVCFSFLLTLESLGGRERLDGLRTPVRAVLDLP